MANKKYVNLKRKSRSKLGQFGSKGQAFDPKILAINIVETGFRYFRNITIGCIAFFVALNVLAPVVIYAWPNIMSHMIFQNFIHLPFKNLSNPGAYGLNHTHSFRLQHDNIELGGWHVLPKGLEVKPSSNLDQHFKLNIEDISKVNRQIVVLYLHGNTNDRSTQHRVQLYILLSQLGYHTVAIDYRGYGDSTGIPTEDDVVQDALFTYEYLQKSIPSATIYIWGHSLGTGISSKLARILSDKNKPAAGLLLEAPFYNVVEEVELHPFTIIFPYHPVLFSVIENAMKSINLQFRSDIHLTRVKSKIMILHAEDDYVIPIYQAEKLHEQVLKNGISPNVTFHRIEQNLRCGHRNIYLAPQTVGLIKSFLV